MAPPLVSFLAERAEKKTLKSLEHICVAAAPSGTALIRKFRSKARENCIYRCNFILNRLSINEFLLNREGWGMSETSPLVLTTPLNDELNGSCGVLVPNTQAKV